MKDAKGHGSEARGGGPTSLRDAERPGIRTPGSRGPSLPSDNIDTMKTIADLRARMSGTGPGHQTVLSQGIDNLKGYSFERGRGR